ncbi:MAG: hypothetical protein CMF49_04645 [Legionellales bacterium]|nr:hypothetical protein [Legionellales bacterium]|tara:strand:+ start:6761 stop:7528 length:768 start_codon:yes stop_codon:yes gene_type:complete
MFIDSHCHLDQLDLAEFDNNFENILHNAHDNQVTKMLCVCIDMQNVNAVIKIAEKYPQIFASVGVHPSDLAENPNFEHLSQLAAHPKVIAIGETGLDYFRGKEHRDTQLARFETHIAVAKALNKPLIIHTREAKADTIALLSDNQAQAVGGVMHCFTEDWTMAQQALDLGFYISISGIVTFKNAENVREVAKKVPLERLLIETDAPYLAPVPMRGKQNQPAYVRYVAEYLAQLRGVSVEELAAHTCQNFYALFIR